MRRFAVSLMLFAMIRATVPFPPVSAQESTHKFTVRTNVVLVPVVVTDKRGNHIPGLTATDFEVKQDGKEQKIASFEEVSSEATPAQRVTGSPRSFTNQVVAQHPKKLVIIALDLLNTSFAGRTEARRGLVKFLSSLDPNTLSALVVFRQSCVSMIHNFTSDPGILIGAIKKLQAPPSPGPTLNVSGDVQSQEDGEAAQLTAILQGTAGGDAGPLTIRGAISVINANKAKMDLSFQHQAGLVTLEDFQQLALYFGSVPGRKSLIWASSGFNFAIGTVTGEATRGATSEDWERTVRMLQDANIAVYPVDVSGLSTSSPGASSVYTNNNIEPGGSIEGRSAILQSIEAGVFHDPAGAKHETMRIVAERTGGIAFYNFNNSDDLFRRATLDSTQYYLLTFATKDINKDGWHKIEIKPKRDGTEVRYRTGFFVTKDMRNPDLTRQTDELLATTSALSFTMLPVTVEWQQVEPAGDKRKVHFSLTFPVGVISIDTEHENDFNMDFLAVARDVSGQNVSQVNQHLARKLPEAAVNQIEGNGLTYVNSLTLPPGEYHVTIVVRDNLTGRIGSITAPLTVQP